MRKTSLLLFTIALSTFVLTSPVGAVDLEAAIGSNGDAVVPGASVGFRMFARNLGNVAATDVELFAPVPAGTLFDPSLSDAGWMCSGDACRFVLPTLAAGTQGPSILLQFVVDDPLAPCREELIVSLFASSPAADPEPGNNEARVAESTGLTCPVAPSVDLAMVTESAGAFPGPGGSTGVRFTPQNLGQVTLTDVRMIATIPLGTSLDMDLTERWSCMGTAAGSVCVSRSHPIAGGGLGESAFLGLVLDDPLKPCTETITVSAGASEDGLSGSDVNLSNNSAAVDLATGQMCSGPEVDLAILGVKAYPFGGVATIGGWRLTPENLSGVLATGVEISAVVPAGTAFSTAASFPTWSCADGALAGTVCTVSVSDFGAGLGDSVVFASRLGNPPDPCSGEVRLGASVGGNELDPDRTNNAVSLSLPSGVACELDLALITAGDLQKFSGPGSVGALRFTPVNNDQSAVAVGAVISAVVPAGTTFFEAGSKGSWNCADGSSAGTICRHNVPPFLFGFGESVTFGLRIDDPLIPCIETMVMDASIGGAGSDPIPSNNALSFDVETGASCGGGFLDFSVSAGAIAPGAGTGSTASVELVVRNEGPVDDAPGTLEIRVPGGTRLSNVGPPAWLCNEGGVAGDRCFFDGLGPSIAPGESRSAPVELVIARPVDFCAGEVPLDVDLQVIGGDPTPENNVARVLVNTGLGCGPGGDLALSAKVDDSVALGDVLVYRFRVEHLGSFGSEGVSLTVTLPEGATAEPGPMEWVCREGRECELALGDLYPFDVVNNLELIVRVGPFAPPTLTAVGVVFSAQTFDPDESNNEVMTNTTVKGGGGPVAEIPTLGHLGAALFGLLIALLGVSGLVGRRAL